MLMRKRIIHQDTQADTPAQPPWLDLEQLAQVEISSEDPAYPIEAALLPNSGTGWRAAGPGEQTIRLRFDQPLNIRVIQLSFEEAAQARTQEFVLRWSADGGESYREIVRQQYSFSPPGTTREVEMYRVDLGGVMVLELHLIPDISGGAAWASLAALRLA